MCLLRCSSWDESVFSFKDHLLQTNPVDFYTENCQRKMTSLYFKYVVKDSSKEGILEYLGKGGEAEENLILRKMFLNFSCVFKPPYI